MENQFDTDEQLRNALRDFEAIPDGGSFDAILEKMNKKKKRRLFIIFFWTGLIALSGIAVPLLFNFYERSKPSALIIAKTQAAASVQNEAGTDNMQASHTASDLHTTQESSSSIHKASSSEASTPEAGADPAGSTQINSGASTVSLSSFNTKHVQEKKRFKQADKQDMKATDRDPELHHKTNADISSIQENSATHNTSSKSKPDKTSSEALASTPIAYEAMYMPVIQIPLTMDSTRPAMSVSLKKASYPALFMAPEKKNTLSFYLGAQASPQLNAFAFSKNPNRDHGYNASEIDFPDFYLNTKKDQRNVYFSLPFGVKAGVQINQKYEVFAGFGIQSFREKEKLYTVSPTTITPTVDPAIPYAAGPNSALPDKNHFRYLYYSLEANRLFQTGKAIGFKLGLGVHGNQLINSSYVFVNSPNNYGSTFSGPEKLSPWLLTTKVKAGVIFNANRRFQLHISPGFFYSPTSIFKKDYVIRQKPYGVDVECLLLFRLFKFSEK